MAEAARHRSHSGVNEWLAKGTSSADELARVDRCVKELNIIAKDINSTWQVLPFGSHVNGLALRTSDLDATCLMPESSSEDPAGNSAVSTLMSVLRPSLKEHPSFKVAEQILGARVPIIKLRFEDSLDVDLSCHNRKPLQNTGLIQTYVKMHPSVRELILAVKMWAKAANVCGAVTCKLSCYTFALMAIYFMQVDPYIRLPCVPTSAFDSFDGAAPENILQPWSCGLPLSILLARFFTFYAEVFSWGAEVVSVRLGRRLESSDSAFSSLAYCHSKRIHVEDPFDLKRNLHCVLGAGEEFELMAAFAEASLLMRDMESSVDLPLAPAPPAMETKRKGERLERTTRSNAVRRQSNRRHRSRSDSSQQNDAFEYSSSVASIWVTAACGCCVYGLYAMYSGQLGRLAVAVGGSLMVLLTMEGRSRSLH
jgi:DNA polymerase sigma